jgi:hypothetical protein
MTPLKRLSLKFFVVAALLITSAALFDTTKADRLSCSACRAAVNGDIGLCYELQQQATNECGVNWIIDPCEVTPAAVCISKCTCN